MDDAVQGRGLCRAFLARAVRMWLTARPYVSLVYVQVGVHGPAAYGRAVRCYDGALADAGCVLHSVDDEAVQGSWHRCVRAYMRVFTLGRDADTRPWHQ